MEINRNKERLSFTEAKRLSLKKWIKIAKNPEKHENIFIDLYWKDPEIRNLSFGCGFCERWKALGYCQFCEFGMVAGKCSVEGSLFRNFIEQPTKEKAFTILEIINNLKENV